MEYIIGTAGHVDHGKTVLVKALTGIDTDRLKEEKERGISIELGFASLVLPGGRRLGLVDVPGHERFVRQMLAGVGGMDLVMLVIAADEGVMPQTKEHLSIIDLLQIKKGIIVLTKIDLVDDEWLELVKEEVRQAVRGTVLAEALIIPVSAVTGEGIPELLKQLEDITSTISPRPAQGKVRMPIDRVFSITGFGTVVTGTLWTGTIRVGDELEIQTKGIKTRVRNLQVHGKGVKEARAGQRVAVNLANVDLDAVKRGNCLLTPGYLKPTLRLDVSLRILEDAQPLENQNRIRFYLGTGEAFGRVVLLESDELKGGETALAQIHMETPVVASREDRFIIRRYSPMKTIGGGLVIDPFPPRHRRLSPSVINSLRQRLEGSSERILEQVVMEQKYGLNWREAAEKAFLPPDETLKILKEMAGEQVKLLLPDSDLYVVSVERYIAWREMVSGALKEFHNRYPLREGMAREELRTRFFSRLPVKVFQDLLEQWAGENFIRLTATTVALSGFQPEFKPGQKKLLRELEERYQAGAWQPPAFSELLTEYRLKHEDLEELIHYLIREEKLVKINEEFYWHREAFRSACDMIKKAAAGKPFSLAEARDALNSSRKYVLPFLEYLDRIKYTRRQGDNRVYIAD